MGGNAVRKKKNGTYTVRKKSIWKDKASWELLLLCVPALLAYILFNYIPMGVAITIPFKDYKFSRGILGSEWVGLENFKWMVTSTSMGRILRNTVAYGAWFMIIGPITNMIIALLLFEVRSRKAFKDLPDDHHISQFHVHGYRGICDLCGVKPQGRPDESDPEPVRGADGGRLYEARLLAAILTIVNIWKGIGMGSMMYFASLMGIDPSLYEAAEIDGANRFQKMRYISLPHLIPLVCIFTILGAGSLINGNFDLFYIIPRNSTILYETTDILNTYVYRALQNGTYAMGATVGLVQSVVGMILVLGTNLIVRKISPDNSMF